MKTLTGHYTDFMRTAAVTMGHGVSLVGAVQTAVGCPLGSLTTKVGDAIATTAVEQCSRDTPKLERCNARDRD